MRLRELAGSRRALRISPADGIAAAGGMEGKHQTGVPSVSRGRSAGAHGQTDETSAHLRVPLPEPTRPNQRWSMDFVSDRLADGRWFRILTVVDQYTRECLCAYADRSQTGEKVVEQMKRLVALRGVPGVDHHRQWQRVRGAGDGRLGASGWREAGLHPAWQAGAERLYRELQRPLAGRMSEW